MIESTIDGATVFQDIVTSAGVSTDLFAAIDNVSRSIRTANSGVEAAKADTGMAKVTLTNQNPEHILLQLHLVKNPQIFLLI